jgi:hypothetical protein
LNYGEGFIVSDQDINRRLARIEAESAITARLTLYCRGIDRRDELILSTIFWPDSQVEYGVYAGSGQEFAASICGWLADGGVELTAHLVGNIAVAIQDQTATSETYLQAYHRIRRPDGSVFDSLIGGRYQDRFECRDGEWRIAFRRLVFDWFREFEGTGDWAVGSVGVTSAAAMIGTAGPDSWAELNAELQRAAGQG